MFNIGFIGGSYYSAVGYTHFAASQLDGIWNLTAGCFSTNTEKNLKSAKVYGIDVDKTYSSIEDLIKNEKNSIDAVAILTPTPSHFNDVKYCMKHEIPVICEKSLAISSAEIRTLLEIQNNLNSFLVVTYNYSGYPMVRELRHIISQGVLGKVLHFQIEMPQEGYVRLDSQGNKPSPQPWRLHDGSIPIIHLDLGSHLHHLLYYLIGKSPLEVIADQRNYGWFNNAIDNVTCLCRYTDNVQGQIWFSKSALGHRNGLKIRIYGSDASAEWHQTIPEEIHMSYNNGKHETIDRAGLVVVANEKRYNRFKAGHPAGFIEAFANLYTDIADCLQQYKTTKTWKSAEVFGADFALEGMRMLEAMALSVENRRWQSV